MQDKPTTQKEIINLLIGWNSSSIWEQLQGIKIAFTKKLRADCSQGILYTVYCILFTVYCVLYTVYCILCTVYCVLYTVYCVLYTVYCILYTCHHFMRNIFSSSLLSKNIKIKIFRQNSNFAVVLYGCETWSLTLQEEHRL